MSLFWTNFLTIDFIYYKVYQFLCFVVAVAQLVRALGCGPRGRGFETHQPPHFTIAYPIKNKINPSVSDVMI